jgi:hypothetical protein
MPAKVLEKPPDNFFQYATAVISHFFSGASTYRMILQDDTEQKLYKDITIYLTNHHQYFFIIKSHTNEKSVAKMWTTTTTIGNNKRKFVTLITSCYKFNTRTVSGLANNKWYCDSYSPVLKNPNLKIINQYPSLKNQ